MTPEELKISIFHYAMQGKLVEQRESEGTANDLYDDILKVAKKDKNVAPIQEDDILFEIPSSWRWCRFGEITDCSMGKTPPRAEAVWWGKDIPWVSISDMTDYGHVIETKERVSQKALDEKFGAISKAGTLLMSFKLTVGRTSILDIDALHNEAIISIFPYVDKNEYFRDYLFYILPIITQWGESKNAIKGKTLNSKSIANLMVPLAPLEEMHRIVAKIEELLPYVDRYAEAYEKLEQFNSKFPEDMKKSILQYAIQGKLVEQRPEEGTAEEMYQQIQEEKQKLVKEKKIRKEKLLTEITEDEIPFDIPQNWKWVRFSEIMMNISTGPFGSMLHKTDYVKNGIPLVNPANIVNGSIVSSDKMMVSKDTCIRLEGYVLHEGMIVMGRRGEMGRCAVVTKKEEGWLCGTGSFFMEPGLGVFAEYLREFFSSSYAKGYLGGESIGTTMNNLNHTILSNMPIPLPPYEEQHRIVKKIEELLPYCESLSAKAK